MNKLLITAILGCISSSLFAASNTYYAPDGTVRERLKEGVEYTQNCVDMCIHDFAALEMAEYLDVARDRGVRVRVVILEHGNDKSRGALAEKLIYKGFDVRVLKRQLGENPLEDFVVLDDRVLVTGAYNWLAYRNRNICNDVLFQYDPESIRDYKNTFCQLFTEAEAIPSINNRKELFAPNNPPVSDTVSDIAGAKQTIQEDILKSEQVAAEESPKTVTEVISRDFIDVSIEEMDKQFGMESLLSRSEKNELWKNYKGKYVRWQGIVAYKGMGRVDWNRIGVNRKSSKNAEVEILFDWRRFEKVMDVRIGSTITYTGKLISRPGINSPYRLDDGDIE
ncbi:MAG TPA: hypothetical protein VI727_03680 [Candidatus Brocadiaceae bacterium]|nr:MAG: hypothetical protein A2Z58_09705 [Planctomycetes bacterium RIFCSPHIGHO2_12_42_15]HLE86744.1 hypothetical protein [Candidatus Brocadiaceae bacterium]